MPWRLFTILPRCRHLFDFDCLYASRCFYNDAAALRWCLLRVAAAQRDYTLHAADALMRHIIDAYAPLFRYAPLLLRHVEDTPAAAAAFAVYIR